MPDVVMPRLSDSMEEGTILRWLVASGAEVSRGDEIVEIETDKANMAYEADASGALEIVAAEGTTVAVGGLIATIGGGSDSGSGSAARRADPVDSGRAHAGPAAGARASSSPPVKVSPIARKLAQSLGVDLAGVTGSGPGGRIVKADVEAAASGENAQAQPAAPADAAAADAGAPGGKGAARSEPLSRLQQTIARRMAETKATVPEFTVATEVDMAAAVSLRAQLKAAAAADEAVPSFNDLIVKASALALREHPRANGAYRDGAFELYERVNVGMAVAAQDALIVPTLFDADRASLRELARTARALAARVRDGSVTPPELSGGTFTVSNLGMFGVTDFTAIINSGQAGILAVGALREEPVMADGRIVPGVRMTLTLSCDHRILYGADAAAFLARIRALLEAPIALAL